MVTASRLLTAAARDVVQDMDQPYDNYHAELVQTFARVLQILREEAAPNAQRRAIETLLTSLASQMGQTAEES